MPVHQRGEGCLITLGDEPFEQSPVVQVIDGVA